MKLNQILKISFLAITFLSGDLQINSLASSHLLPNEQPISTPNNHPYLFVNQELVQKIKVKPDLRLYSRYARQRYLQAGINPDNIEQIRTYTKSLTSYEKLNMRFAEELCMFFGIDGVIAGNKPTIMYAKEYVNALLSRSLDYIKQSNNDQVPIGKVFALGLCYDWLYDHLEASSKEEMRRHIIETLEHIDRKWQFYSQPHYLGGHSRYANYTALTSLLAINSDMDSEKADLQLRYNSLLSKITNNWTQGYLPMEEYVCNGGGHVMGWSYGTSYTNPMAYVAWEFATDNQSLLGDYQNNRTFNYLYALRNNNKLSEIRAGGYDKFPFYGDAYPMEYGNFRISFQLLVSAYFYGNKHAMWLYNQLDEGKMYQSHWDILYKHFGKTEGEGPEGLSLSRHFENSGFVTIRDSWDFEDNTLMIFKSSSFYSYNHHHKDQNSFTIYYQAPLASESGGYAVFGGYNSDHWKNYYTRSIAHNTITVYNPEEEFRIGKKLVSNDGGQQFFKQAYPNLADILPGGSNHLDGVIHYDDSGEMVYVKADATKAYSNAKLKNYDRSVVFIRKPQAVKNYVVIYDEVEAAGTFKTSYLLHSHNKPAVNNSNVTIMGQNKLILQEGVLTHHTVLPEHVNIETVGGWDNGKTFWVGDNGMGVGKNYYVEGAKKKLSSKKQRALTEAGAWRVEISPQSQTTQTNFLHLLAVSNHVSNSVNLPYTLIKNEAFQGLVIHSEQLLVLFRYSDLNQKQQSITTDDQEIKSILIFNLSNTQSIDLSFTNGKVNLTERKDMQGAYTVTKNKSVYITFD